MSGDWAFEGTGQKLSSLLAGFLFIWHIPEATFCYYFESFEVYFKTVIVM